MRRIHRLSKVITASTAILNSLCLILIGPSSALAQCDWSKKIAFAIQRRYQTNENACKALLAPPDEFNQAHALVENQLLSQFRFVTDPRLDGWLEHHSQQIFSQFIPHSSLQTSRVAYLF